MCQRRCHSGPMRTRRRCKLSMPWKRRCRNGCAVAIPFKAKALDAWLPRGEQQTLLDKLTAGASPGPALTLPCRVARRTTTPSNAGLTGFDQDGFGGDQTRFVQGSLAANDCCRQRALDQGLAVTNGVRSAIGLLQVTNVWRHET